MYFLSNYDIESKAVRDPLYTFIELPKIFLSVIDHALFQRLRWVSQLPLEQLVYPSAQHSRFEHSIGVMYLAMLASVSLLKNSKNVIYSYLNSDPHFKTMSTDEEKAKNFILSAGFAGLLHDVGHAPFSHTLEEACKYSKIKYKYNHEEVGLKIARYLISETGLSKEIFAIKALQALNKDLKTVQSSLEPIEMVIRKIIDGPIDVDKGDYIYRDSYHCGTNYGFYDIQRLWRNICVEDGRDKINVTPKGALEAWTLRLQRYKMYTNIYKHHIRNITDAMLIDILASCFESLTHDEKKLRELIPIIDDIDDLDMNIFTFWTDNSILKSISSHNHSASQRINMFLSRKLYKPSIYYDLSVDYPNLPFPLRDSNEIYLELRKIKKDLHKDCNLDFDFIINKEELPPVFDSSVQEEISVVNTKGSSTPLAEYLGFVYSPPDTKDSSEDENRFPLGYKYYLRFFVDKNCQQMVKKTLKPKIDLFLDKYKIQS